MPNTRTATRKLTSAPKNPSRKFGTSKRMPVNRIAAGKHITTRKRRSDAGMPRTKRTATGRSYDIGPSRQPRAASGRGATKPAAQRISTKMLYTLLNSVLEGQNRQDAQITSLREEMTNLNRSIQRNSRLAKVQEQEETLPTAQRSVA